METSPKKELAADLVHIEQLEVDFDGFKAIRGLDFSLQRGELRFLIGPNGAGKTTLLDVLCGKVKPSKGTVRFKNSIDITKHQEHQIAQLGIGRKFQAPSIFITLSVLENLLLSMRQKRGLLSSLIAKTTADQRERIKHYLQMIGLEHKSQDKAGSLSHGEKQWLEIGMLLIQEPELLLLDEPAAGMTDSETEKTGELLHKISDKQTIIVVEHDMEFVRQFAKTVTVMHEGSVLCEGTMEDIQNDDKVAEVYLGRRGVRDAEH
ncbi:urea ABC transporter ATP-binding protein UrtD [Paenibacillus radicis (ex Xue et al. 2023)]|uniref:Urea ABC transporter ATP-binding protein UrtD n=1 Tax=Paenibacillus radicis (ex Xue et al. 2023) TaxID=2972489 RepID=A0ABT1Y9S5_9BACL|nr:urea ABC transporter ATP-binding protein UrtD [Paenibacillus radicis (ex Xue et al. 2023)]MCR8629932.1 urea ABC transporter ATP-binding protein UrtD [Paenibacillus radicis (ex Xue et al. 2023)]